MEKERRDPFPDAKWAGGATGAESPLILRRFQVRGIKKATLFSTGLGYLEASIHGRKAGEGRFLPVVSDYEPRDTEKLPYPLHDETTHAVYYCFCDMTPLPPWLEGRRKRLEI